MGILTDPDEEHESLCNKERNPIKIPAQALQNSTTQRQPTFKLPRTNMEYKNMFNQHNQKQAKSSPHDFMADDLRRKKKYMLLGYIGFLAHHQMLPWQANYTGPIIEPRLGPMNVTDFRTTVNTHSTTKESTSLPPTKINNSQSCVGDDIKHASHPGTLNESLINKSQNSQKKFECFRPWKTNESNSRSKPQKLIIQPLPQTPNNVCNFITSNSECLPNIKQNSLKNDFQKNNQKPNPVTPPSRVISRNSQANKTEQKIKTEGGGIQQCKEDVTEYFKGLKKNDSNAYYELAAKALGMKLICLKKIILAHGIDLDAELKKEEYTSILSSQRKHIDIKLNLPTTKNEKSIPMADKLFKKPDSKHLPKILQRSNVKSSQSDYSKTPRIHQKEKSKTSYSKISEYPRDVNQKQIRQEKGISGANNLKHQADESKLQGKPISKSAKAVSLEDFFKQAQNVFKLQKIDTKYKNKKYKVKRCNEKSRKPKPLRSEINLKKPIKLKLKSSVPVDELECSKNDAAFDHFIDFIQFIGSSTKEQAEKMIEVKSSSEAIQKDNKQIPVQHFEKTRELENSNNHIPEINEIDKPTMMDVDRDIAMMPSRNDNNCDSNYDFLYDSDVEDFDFGSDESD